MAQHIETRSIRPLLSCVVLVSFMLIPGSAFSLRIAGPGDVALAGALMQDFDGEAADTYFTSQTFSMGLDGFTVAPASTELHIDDQYCASFGTTGNCLDTFNVGDQPNDDFDVTFTGSGVTAFGFVLNALDNDWTVQTYGTTHNLLGTYFIASQSPGLTGFNRQGYFGATEVEPIQYFTVRSAGDDRALIDDFSYLPVPEPNVAMLLGLSLLTLAGTRIRDLQPRPPAPPDPDES